MLRQKTKFFSGRLLPALLAIAGAAVVGYAGGYVTRSAGGPAVSDGQAAADTHPSEPHAERNEPSTSPKPLSADFDASRWPAAKARLRALWRTSPGGVLDVELRAETQRLLGNTPPAELEAFFREFGGDAYTREATPEDLLRTFILEVWAQKGGPAMIEALALAPVSDRSGSDPILALYAWGGKNPEQALEWLEGNLPPALAAQRASLRISMLTSLAGQNFPKMETHLATLEAADRFQLLNGLSQSSGYTPSLRENVLGLAATLPPEEATRVRTGVLQAWAGSDPAGALAELAAMNLPEPERAKLDAALVLGQSLNEPAAALKDWAERNPPGSEIPGDVLTAVSYWTASKPAEVAAWLKSTPAGPQRDTFTREVVLATARPHNANYNQAANLADGIGNEAVRVDTLRALKKVWAVSKPQAAAAWEANLPESDREALK